MSDLEKNEEEPSFSFYDFKKWLDSQPPEEKISESIQNEKKQELKEKFKERFKEKMRRRN